MTSAERRKRIAELFTQAAALAPAERNEFLDLACRDDPEGIRAEVTLLLHSDDALQNDDHRFLSPAPLNLASMLTDEDRRQWEPPPRIGPYKIKRLLGEGGFGKVYLATRVDDYHRDVAIKIAQRKSGEDDCLLQRFAQERQVLADLGHENIARLLGGGATEEGHPYFVLEYVAGAPITEYCDRQHLDIAGRLKLFQQVCRAVAYAHRYGVIHRDLKPGNILVTGDGTPKLIDFGIAKLTGPASARHRLATTRAGLLAFTPDYASPEQVRGVAVTTASDVYSLGVVLYELLAGSRPFILTGLSPVQAEQTLCDTMPPAPSVRVGQPEENLEDKDPGEPLSGRLPVTHSATAAELRRTLTGDLDNIVLKSLHHDSERRYRSPDELADDIERYFEGRPVRAQPDSRAYRLKKYVLRHRWAVAAVALILLSLLGGIITTSLALNESVHHQKLAERWLARSRRNVYNLQISRVSNLWLYDPRQTLGLLNDESFCPPKLREFTWGFYRQLCEPNRAILGGHRDAVYCVAWSPTEDTIASAGREGTIKLWDSRTFKESATLAGHDSWIKSLDFSADGKLLASASRDRTVKLWHVATRKEVATLAGHTGMVDAVAFSPHGDVLASASSDGSIRLWDVESSREFGHEFGRPMAHDGRVQCIAFSPDGTTLASSGYDRQVKLWNIETGELTAVFSAHEQNGDFGAVLALAFSPDGKTLASADANRLLYLWNVATHRRTDLQGGPKRSHTRAICALTFSPDGKTLASASYDMSVRLWDVDQAKEKARLDGHTGFVRSIAYSPDGLSLVSGSNDGTIRIWDVSGQPEQRTIPGHGGNVFQIAFSPDGTVLASAGEDKTVRIWDVRTGERLSVLSGHRESVRCVAFSPSGSVLASGGFDCEIKLWDYENEKELSTLKGHNDRIQTLAFSPNGSTLASGSRAGAVKLWRIETAEEVATLEGHRQRVTSVCFSLDGTTLATASRDGTIGLWDLQSRQLRQTIQHGDPVGSIAFSPDGKTLAAGPARVSPLGTCAGTITLWDIASLTARQVCRGHTDEVFCISYSPDGKTLVSASADRTIKLWDPLTGQQRTTLTSHRTWVYAAKFSPDGCWLASSGENIKLWHSRDGRGILSVQDGPTDGFGRLEESDAVKDEHPLLRLPEQISLQTTAKSFLASAISQDAQMAAALTAEQTILLWDTGTGGRRFTLRGHRGPIEFVAFSPDGRYLASTSRDGSVRIWRTDNGRLLAAFDDHQSRPVCAAFSPDARILVTREIEGRMVVRDIALLDGSFSRVPNRLGERLAAPPVFSADGALLSCGANNGELALWDTRTWGEIRFGGQHDAMVRTVAFSNHGKLLASGSDDLDQPIILWDLANRQRRLTLRGHTDALMALAFSPDDATLASAAGGHDPTVRLWDVRTGHLLATLPGSENWFCSLAWSPDGQMLVLVDCTGNVRRWDRMARRLADLARLGVEQ